MHEDEIAIQQATQSTGADTNLQSIADCIEDELLIIDRGYHIRFVNSAMQRRLPQSYVPVGKRCYKVFEGRDNPCNSPIWECPLTKVLQNGSPATIVHPDHPAGAGGASSRYIKITMYPLRDSHGDINAFVELRRDVSAERELERQILRRHHHLYALSRISGAVSGLRDLDTILDVSLGAVLEIFDSTVGGVLLFDEANQRLRYRAYRGLPAKHVERMQMGPGEGVAGRVAQTGEPIIVEDISKDPRAAYPDLASTEGLKGFASIPLKAKEKVVGVMNIAIHSPGQFGTYDLYLLNSIGYQVGTAVEQARLYQRLERADKRHQTLLQHALTAQEEERRRIARELHDETSQAITSLTLNLQATIATAEMKGVVDAELMDRIKKTQSLAVHAGNEIVRIMKELRPTLLDELGLATAINRYAKDSLEPRGINISMEFRGMDERLPSDLELMLFRVAQGAIGNILEHSKAKNASITLECNARECVLHIEDDGKGFAVSKITKVDRSGRGAGLFTMKERVNLIGGACSVKSQPGKGTKVVVEVPLVGNTLDAEDNRADS